jgi:2-C-methyl-D-erythritol 4-phosphate cytidylyltransferase
MIYAGILAAGMGERMHRQDLPKQFLNLGTKPIIIHTLEQFYVNAQVDKVVVVVPEDWLQYAADLIGRYDSFSTEVHVISGGSNKTLSVQMVTEYIKDNWGMGDGDILITHDAVRPFVTQRMIEDNLKVAENHGAAITVMVTNDTIIVSKDGEFLSSVPSKTQMMAEQTPITFKLKTLDDVFKLSKAKGYDLKEETEIVRLYISQGHKMRLVSGEYSNMKIINPYDLEVAEALLRERKND